MSTLETILEVDQLVEGKELLIRCMDTGTYTRSVLTEGKAGREGVTVAYVCRGMQCSAPLDTLGALVRELREGDQ